MATEEERFEEKFYEVKRRLDAAGVDTTDAEHVIYGELRRDPNEDAGTLAFRIKG
jgi:hypothetical protein